MESGNPIKEENLKRLRNILRKEKTATKSRLSELSSLSVVTVQSLTKALIKSEEIKEDSVVQPQLGRPAVSYRFNENARLALVIYMYEKEVVDTAVFLVCNLFGECVERKEQSFKQINMDSYNDTIEALLGKYKKIKIIAFGLPAVTGDGVLISDYASLSNMDFASYIHDKFGIDVFLENDINAATAGYCHRNNMLENACVTGIYMPSKYPPGAGVCRNGEIIKGRDSYAGEIKYLPFDITWETFSYGLSDVENFLVKAMKVYMCVCNPDRIVIYSTQTGADIIGKLKNSCNSHEEMRMLPDIEVIKQLKGDFETGMINLALNKIL